MFPEYPFAMCVRGSFSGGLRNCSEWVRLGEPELSPAAMYIGAGTCSSMVLKFLCSSHKALIIGKEIRGFQERYGHATVFAAIISLLVRGYSERPQFVPHAIVVCAYAICPTSLVCANGPADRCIDA